MKLNPISSNSEPENSKTAPSVDMFTGQILLECVAKDFSDTYCPNLRKMMVVRKSAKRKYQTKGYILALRVYADSEYREQPLR